MKKSKKKTNVKRNRVRFGAGLHKNVILFPLNKERTFRVDFESPRILFFGHFILLDSTIKIDDTL